MKLSQPCQFLKGQPVRYTDGDGMEIQTRVVSIDFARGEWFYWIEYHGTEMRVHEAELSAIEGEEAPKPVVSKVERARLRSFVDRLHNPNPTNASMGRRGVRSIR